MSFITLLGSMDTLVITSRLRAQYWEHLEGDGTMRTLELMDEDGQRAILKGERGWKSAASFLTRLRSQSAPLLGGRPAEFYRVWIEALQPHGYTPWREEPPGDTAHIRICLSTPLSAPIYCGGETIVLLPGSVAHVDTRQLHSWVNFGDWPAIHLCADVLRPEELT